MAQRRPIASHPAFGPLVALWFAALFGLAVAVLPVALVERLVASLGLRWLGPAGPMAASGAAALIGGVSGLLIAKLIARRAASDPRPVYSEPAPEFEQPLPVERRRRPLSIREELTAGFPGHAEEMAATEIAPDPEPGEAHDDALTVDALEEVPPRAIEVGGDFLILSPQPVHPPQPAPDLDSLLAQFDTALAAFRSDDEPRRATQEPTEPDPVHAFVARQTGAPAASPLGGMVPDHQSELRAALDKLARARRRDGE